MGEPVDAYRQWIMQPAQDELRQAAAAHLAGKNLACWCPGPPCHADVLLAIVGDLVDERAAARQAARA